MAIITVELQGVDNVSGMLESVGDIAGGVLSAGLAAAAAGFTALAAGAGIALSAAMDNEKIQAELAQVLKATGGAAGLTQDAANDLANQFRDLAGGSDDAILAIETIGLRAGTISAEEMPNFIQSVLDLGTVMGDTAGAATLLARAQDDPLAAFKRIERSTGAYDIALEEQIKTLQENGDTAGAVALIMDKLAETTGGAAAAQAETLAGKWEILKGNLGEAAETIGMSLLPFATELFDNVIAPAIPIVEGLASSLGGMITNLIASLPGLLAQAQATFQPVIDAAVNLGAAFSASMPMIQASVQVMSDFVVAKFNELSPTLIANVSSTLNSLAEFWTAHGTTIMATVTLAFEFIVTYVGVTLTTLSGIVAAALELINGDTTNAMGILQNTFTTVMDSILSLVGTDLETFVSSWQGTFALLQEIIQVSMANVLLAITGGLADAIAAAQAYIAEFLLVGQAIVQGIVDGITSAGTAMSDAITNMVAGAINAAKETLGIQSPSTVFAGIGQNMMAGMTAGIVGGAGGPIAATAMVAGQTAGAASWTNTFNISNPNPSAVAAQVSQVLAAQARQYKASGTGAALGSR